MHLQASHSSDPLPYNLYGLIIHIGESVTSGHYICYVLVSHLWFECNDEQITPVSAAYVRLQARTATMLFYSNEAASPVTHAMAIPAVPVRVPDPVNQCSTLSPQLPSPHTQKRSRAPQSKPRTILHHFLRTPAGNDGATSTGTGPASTVPKPGTQQQKQKALLQPTSLPTLHPPTLSAAILPSHPLPPSPPRVRLTHSEKRVNVKGSTKKKERVKKRKRSSSVRSPPIKKTKPQPTTKRKRSSSIWSQSDNPARLEPLEREDAEPSTKRPRDTSLRVLDTTPPEVLVNVSHSQTSRVDDQDVGQPSSLRGPRPAPGRESWLPPPPYPDTR